MVYSVAQPGFKKKVGQISKVTFNTINSVICVTDKI